MNDSILDKETAGNPVWTVGAQAGGEYDAREHTYRLLRIDHRCQHNPRWRALVKGGMCMGFGLGSCEYFKYDPAGKVLDTSFDV